MEFNLIKIEVRKHHVTPGVNVLDMHIEANGEKIIKQTQHKDIDRSFQKFLDEIVRVSKDLAEAPIEGHKTEEA